MKIRALSVVAVVLLALVGCSDDDTTTAGTTSTVAPVGGDSTDDSTEDEPQAVVIIAGAWARTSPMMATNGAAYMELTATVDDRLLSATASGIEADSIEVHEVAMDDDTGEMTMREVDGIDLPAGETVALEPGGYHIMFLGLAEPFEVGDSFDLILTFEQAGEVAASVQVRDSADGGDSADQGMMGDGH